MRRRHAAVTAAVIVLAVLPATAPAATFQAYSGGDRAPGLSKQASPNAFYPRVVTIHPGDTVRWDFRGFHSVTFPPRGKQPPALVLVDTKEPVSGLSDAAGNPFWFNGRPNLLFNPVVALPSKATRYNGSTVLNSGLPLGAKPKPYGLRFRRTGTFTYYCAVHPGMKARVTVVSASRAVPTPTAQLATAKRELAADVRAAKKAGTAPAPSGSRVDVGRTTSRVAVYQMFPKTLTVAAGQPVTFTMAGQYRSEVHTVTFGPANVRSDLEKNFIGPLPGLPPSALGLNPKAVYPSDPPPSLPPQDGTNHGDGFENTGLLDNDPSTPFPASATITFAKPGTYDYECVVHAHMDGRIVVT